MTLVSGVGRAAATDNKMVEPAIQDEPGSAQETELTKIMTGEASIGVVGMWKAGAVEVLRETTGDDPMIYCISNVFEPSTSFGLMDGLLFSWTCRTDCLSRSARRRNSMPSIFAPRFWPTMQRKSVAFGKGISPPLFFNDCLSYPLMCSPFDDLASTVLSCGRMD